MKQKNAYEAGQIALRIEDLKEMKKNVKKNYCCEDSVICFITKDNNKLGFDSDLIDIESLKNAMLENCDCLISECEEKFKKLDNE